MQDYDEAPYLELDDYKAPRGIKPIFLPMKDGNQITINLLENFSRR